MNSGLMVASFQSLQPIGGKVSGEKAKPIMMASKLPLDALGKVGVQTQHAVDC